MPREVLQSSLLFDSFEDPCDFSSSPLLSIVTWKKLKKQSEDAMEKVIQLYLPKV
jgi:hypothetical protein